MKFRWRCAILKCDQYIKPTFQILRVTCSKLGARQLSSAVNSGINFSLSCEQKEIQDVARKFAREEIIPVAAHYDKTGEFPWPIIKKAWGLGLMNGRIPLDVGGLGLDVLTSCVVAEEIAFGCTGIAASMSISSLAQVPVICHGTEAQKKKYLCRLLEEPMLTAFCATETGAGSDVSAVKTTALKKGDEYILNGSKIWITNGGVANWYFVLARTDPDPKVPANKAFTGFIVDRDLPGVSVGNKLCNMGQRASDTRIITFDDVRVPKENVVLEEGAGFKLTMLTFNATRPEVASGAQGLAARCLDESLKYACQRRTFGSPIANHQAIQFMLADMAIGIETGQLMCRKAAWEIDRNIENSFYSAIAKCYVADMAVKASQDAVQIFGGYGYNTDYPIEKLMRDAKIYQIYGGTSQIQRIVISRKLIANQKPL